MSLLLGWGAGYPTRYVNGDIPTKQYSAYIEKIQVEINL
ncbi:prophage ps3 protein 01 (plasmid) [Bacillus thuringiensis serovar kurstaki str. YBT-1520]|nr:prophage ps3 protein 01 [Bacillus thuringiensis serovar kurstaki str. YBT-1520]